ncbi:lysozyme [Devosia algicola]|uniref:Lysozyme n=1 Tax=Devosia algicola TaxID=3026418 RepID=A0ABY7YQK6_9HYPH|nr:lysozyme [Devosia algicola]WDR03614.1 lysozyme [Devosia algicola]
MALNSATLKLVREYEGFVDHWYPDPAHGWKVPTCCIGHTDAAGDPKYADTKSKRFSEGEAYDILAKDLRAVEAMVNRAVKVPLNANQRGALVSFTFNLGGGNLNKSTLLKKLNRGDYKGASKEFSKWINAAGKPMAGLKRRREAERLLFLSTEGLDDAPAPSTPKSTKSPLAALAAALAVIVAAAVTFLKAKGILP